MNSFRTTALLSAFALALASCAPSSAGDKASPSASSAQDATTTDKAGLPFTIKEVTTFEEPWAMAFVPGTGVLMVTEKRGSMRGLEPNGRAIFVSGVPKVDYGGQGGFGDIAFLQSEAASTLTPRTIYLSWVEPDEGNTRGAVVGKGRMVCEDHQTCEIRDLDVIWRQQPKVTGRGHFSHRIAISPDEKYLFVSSGDRQKLSPAQDISNSLGTIVRLNLDGSPAAANPLAAKGSPSNQIWSYGHRNILGLAFDPSGRLWGLEHGPRGGDELNLIKEGENYGWPVVSNGVHYSGERIPHHSTRPEFQEPAISWDPVIAPGDMIFYTSDLFPEWRDNVIIAAMKPAALVRVAIEADTAREVARYPMEHRIRAIELGPEGQVYILEDGKNLSKSRLLKLSPRHD